MIAIRYLVFFINPKQEKPYQLSAVQPLFASPAAVETLTRTLKFEDQKAVSVIGNREQLEDFVSKVERLDVTDWGDFEADERKNALISFAKECGLEAEELIPAKGDNQVLSLEPLKVEAKVAYPSDLPKQNYAIWDLVFSTYKDKIKQGKTIEEKEAMHRLLYKNVASKMNFIPWENITSTKQTEQRNEIKNEISRGEERAVTIINKLTSWLMGEDYIKKPRSQKHFDTDYNMLSSKYEITHVIGAKTKVHWDALSKFLLHRDSFNRKGKTTLSMTVDRTTRLDVEHMGEDLGFYIVHSLTPQQAVLLTQETQEDLIVKKLNKIVKLWYQVGEFPTVD